MQSSKLRLWVALVALPLASAAHAQMGGGMAPTPSMEQADPTIPFQKGVAALDSGDFTTAVKELRKARDARPDDGVINYALGRAYAGAGKKKEAKSAFQGAVHSQNAPVQAHVELALIALELGDRKTADGQYAALNKKMTACNSRCSDADREQLKAAMDKLAGALGTP